MEIQRRGVFRILLSISVVVSGGPLLSGPVSLADESQNSESTIQLDSLIDPQRVTDVSYSMTIQGKLLTPSGKGTTDWDLKSSADFAFQQRRFPSDASGPMSFRAVRRFQQAETSSVVGKDHESTVVLPAQSRLIHVFGGESQLTQLSPDVRLTRPQVDLLQFPCDPLVATGLLPGRALASREEKWNADNWVVPMLSGMDAVVSQSASCSLRQLSDAEAVISFDCQGTGAVTGSPTEVSLKGEMVFDRKQQVIRSLKATLVEKRGAGTVSPGLQVTAGIQWTQKDSVDSKSFPVSMPDQSPQERQLLLTLVTPWRILLLHDRKWHIFHETADLVMLRMLHNGVLVGQCNIASAPLKSAGASTSEAEYYAEVEKALQERGGRIQDSNVVENGKGWRVHHIRAAGEASKKPLIWDYYLCTAKTGEQISLVFSHAEEDAAVFQGAAEQMLDSLTVRSAKPRIALPR